MTQRTPGTNTGRKAMAGGLAVGLVGGAAAGLIFGLPGTTSADAPAAVVQQVDEQDEVDEQEEIDDVELGEGAPEPGDRLRDALQELVDDGTISAEQADAVATHLAENRPEGRHGPGGRPGHHLLHSDVLSSVLGLEADEIRDLLRDGSTLAEIAEAQGVDTQQLVDEMVAEAQERVDEAVADGRIDEAEAADKLAEIEERVTTMVNEGAPARADDEG